MSKILVVDDSLFDLKRASLLLEKQMTDAVILEAQDGEAALAVIEEHQPDVVVTDLKMPKINGLELVLESRSRFPLIPVVLMTAAGSEEIALEALKNGAASYVPKSQLTHELASIVSRLLCLAREKDHLRRLQGMLLQASYVLDQNRRMHTAFIQEFRAMLEARNEFSENDCFRITTALDEAISNAHYHGNLEISSELREHDLNAFEDLALERSEQQPYQQRKIHVNIDFQHCLKIVVRDEGPGFDPSGLPDPFADGFTEKSSGRGILLMRSFMDQVEFNSQGNQVTLVKNMEPLVSLPT